MTKKEAATRFKQLEEEAMNTHGYEACKELEKRVTAFANELSKAQYKELFGGITFTESLMMKIKGYEWRRDHPDSSTTATG